MTQISLYKLQWYRRTRMNVYLLRNPPSTLYGIMLLLSLGTQLSRCYKLLSRSVVFFLSIGKGLHRCKGVQYIFILWLNLSLTNFYTTTVYSCALAKGDRGCANVTRTNPAFVHKVTVTQSGKWAWCRVWSEEHTISY